MAEEQQGGAELPPLKIDETERILARLEQVVRDVLKLNERIFRFAQEDRCSKLASERGIEAFDAVLDDERLPEKFRTVRLLQMRQRIRSLRDD